MHHSINAKNDDFFLNRRHRHRHLSIFLSFAFLFILFFWFEHVSLIDVKKKRSKVGMWRSIDTDPSRVPKSLRILKNAVYIFNFCCTDLVSGKITYPSTHLGCAWFYIFVFSPKYEQLQTGANNTKNKCSHLGQTKNRWIKNRENKVLNQSEVYNRFSSK